MKSMRRALGRAVGLLWLSAVAGCGMAQKSEAPAASPAPAAETQVTGAPGTAEAEPQTLAEAEALLERSRADLERLALNEGAPPPASAAGAAAPAAEPAPAPVAPKSAPRDEARSADKADADAPARAQAKAPNACETACKAFSSLSRASDAVCRLDSDGGKRCERARQIQQDASRRVASCSCAQ